MGGRLIMLKTMRRMLSRVTSSVVGEMTINVYRLSFERGTSALDLWHDIDHLLAQPQFSMLKTVRIDAMAEQLSSQSFTSRLPQCHSRGILSFESCSDGIDC